MPEEISTAEQNRPESAGADSRATLSRGLLKSASGSFVLQAASRGAAFLTALLLARFLGPDGYGLYAFALGWAVVFGIVSTLGLNIFLVRNIPAYEVQEEWGLMRGLLRRSHQLVFLASVTVAFVGCLVAVAWLSPTLRGPFCLAMLLVPLSALTQLRQGAMQGFRHVVRGQVPELLVRPMLILVGICALEFLGNDILSPTTALAVNVFAAATAVTVGTILLLRVFPPALRLMRPEVATAEWLRSSIPMLLVSGFFILNNYVGVLVVGTIRGPSAAGVYTAVQAAAAIIVLFMVAASMPLAPAVARLRARGNWIQLQESTERLARTTLLVSAPICIGLAAFPGVALSIFGNDFRVGSTALTVIALCQLVNAVTGPAATVLTMTGHESVTARIVGAGAFANLVLSILLVPPFGVAGAAVAFGSSLAMWNIALAVIARRTVGVNVTAFRRLSVSQSDRPI